jgi:hypothetical protein
LPNAKRIVQRVSNDLANSLADDIAKVRADALHDMIRR